MRVLLLLAAARSGDNSYSFNAYGDHCFGESSIPCPDPFYPAVDCGATTCEVIEMLVHNPETGGWPGGGPMKYITYYVLNLVNAEQRLLPGYEVRVAYVDDGCNSQASKNLYVSEMLSNASRYVAFGGTSCSGTAMTTLSLSTDVFYLPHVGWACSSQDLSHRGLYPNFFRTRVAESGFIQAWVSIMDLYGWDELGVVVGDILRFDELSALTLLDLGIAGKKVTFQHRLLDPATQTDGIIGSMMAYRTRVVIVLAYADKLRALLCRAAKLGVSDAVWMTMGWQAAGWALDREIGPVFDEGISSETYEYSEMFACTPAEMGRQAVGAIGTNGDLWSADMDAALDCVDGYSAQSLKDWYLNVGLGGSGHVADGAGYVDQISAGTDGLCTMLFMVRKLLETYSAADLRDRSKRVAGIYADALLALEQTDFVGMSAAHIRFQGLRDGVFTEGMGAGDLAGGIALWQEQRPDPASPPGRVNVGKFTPPNTFTSPELFSWQGFAGDEAPPTLFPECEPGKVMASGACTPCPAGSAENRLHRKCESCLPGMFSASEGSLRCSECSVGTKGESEGMSECTPCPPGEFAPGQGATECMKCRLGTFSADGGGKACDRCPVGSYQDEEGQTSCTSCAEGKTTEYFGAEALDACSCAPGSYEAPAAGCGSCDPYPYSLVCDGFRAQPESKEGYLLKLTGSAATGFDIPNLYRCADVQACPGGAAGTCAEGLEADLPACGKCKEGHFSRKGGCEKCEGSGGDVLGPILVIVVILCCPLVLLGCYKLANSPLTGRTSTILVAGLSIGSGVTAFQMMGTFELFSITWPGFFPDILQFFQIFMFDFDIIRWECALSPGMLQKYFVRAILPALIVMSYTMMYLISIPLGMPMLKTKVTNSTGTLLQVLFMSIAMNSFVPFQCYNHLIPADSQSMLKYPSVLCSSDDHGSMVAMGAVAVLFTLGMLGAVVYLTMSAPRLSAADEMFLAKYKFLFFRFRSDRYYFNTLFLMRNFLIGLGPAITTSDQVAQTGFVLCVALGALSLQMYLWPWREWILNWCDGIVLSTMALICACSMAIVNPSFMVRDTVDLLVQMFALIQILAITFVVVMALYNLAVHRNKIVMTEAHKEFCKRLCKDVELVAATIKGIETLEHEASYLMLPDYDLNNLRQAVGLFSKIYDIETTQTGTKRISLGIKHVVAAVHKTSLEGQKN